MNERNGLEIHLRVSLKQIMAAMGLLEDEKKKSFSEFKRVLEAAPDDTNDGFVEVNIEASSAELVGVLGPLIIVESKNDEDALTFLKRMLLAQIAPSDQETTDTSDSDSDHGPCN